MPFTGTRPLPVPYSDKHDIFRTPLNQLNNQIPDIKIKIESEGSSSGKGISHFFAVALAYE